MAGAGSAADGASKKLLRRVLWVFLLLFGSIAIFVALLYGHFKSSQYQDATPTSATIESCSRYHTKGEDSINCSGTWSVDGQQYHGPVNGVGSVLAPGSRLDVRADSFYAFASAPSSYTPTIVVCVVIGIAAAALVAWGRFTRRPD